MEEGEETGGVDAGPGPSEAIFAQAEAAQADFEAFRDRRVKEFPLLTGFMDPDRAGELEGMTQPYFQEKLGSKPYSDELTGSLGTEAQGNLKKIRALREKAESGGITVWQLPRLVELTKETLGYGGGTLAGRLIDDHLKDYEHDETVKTLWWSALALALSVIGALPTGGMSVGAAAGAMTAKVGAAAIGGAMLYKDAMTFQRENLASAVGLADKPSLFWLFVNFGFTAVDLVGLRDVLRTLRPAIAATTTRIALHGALKAMTAADDDAAALLKKAINEMGIAQTQAVSNKTLKELEDIAAKDPELLARIQAAKAAPVTVDDVPTLLTQVKSATPERLAEVSEALARAIDSHGALPVIRAAGGWKAIVGPLGDNSPASQRLLTWRDEVVGGALEEFGTTLPRANMNEKGIVRTGTQGAPSNDFDWSTLGPHSSENRDAVYHFLEQRFGLSRTEMKRTLHGDFFTDPRRLHLYDELEPELREHLARTQMEFSEKLVYNRMLHDAKKAGASDDYQMKLITRMQERGIYDPDYVEMTDADIGNLNIKIDEWHQALGEAKTLDEKKDLITKIGQAQGQINAMEGGGYLTGGGVSAFGKLPDAAYPPMLKVQSYEAALEHMLKLQHALDEFEELAALAAEAAIRGDLVQAIKDLAKYGSRYNQMAEDLLFSPVAGDLSATLTRLASAFEVGWNARLLPDMLAEVRSGNVLARLGTDPTAVIDEARHAIDDLLSKHDEIMSRLRAEARALSPAADPTPLAVLQRVTILKLRIDRACATVRANLGNIQSALFAAEDYIDMETQTSDPELIGAASPAP